MISRTKFNAHKDKIYNFTCYTLSHNKQIVPPLEKPDSYLCLRKYIQFITKHINTFCGK
jgi:hypothetical protein